MNNLCSVVCIQSKLTLLKWVWPQQVDWLEVVVVYPTNIQLQGCEPGALIPSTIALDLKTKICWVRIPAVTYWVLKIGLGWFRLDVRLWSQIFRHIQWMPVPGIGYLWSENALQKNKLFFCAIQMLIFLKIFTSGVLPTSFLTCPYLPKYLKYNWILTNLPFCSLCCKTIFTIIELL